MFSNRESTHLFTHTLATSKVALLEGKPSLLKLPPLFTLPRKFLLHLINWGTQWTMEISSNEYVISINVGSDTFGNPIFQKGLQN